MNDGGPAFPCEDYTVRDGMTLRDWFAGQAFVAIYPQWRGGNVQVVAKEAVYAADALIAELKQEATHE